MSAALKVFAKYVPSTFLLFAGCTSPNDDSRTGREDQQNSKVAAAALPQLTWAEKRPVVADTIVHRFVRSLLAQGRMNLASVDTTTTFFLGKTLIERKPILYPSSHKCITCYTPNLSERLLRKLVIQRVLLASDTIFMQSQIQSSLSFKLSQKMLPGYKIISVDTLRAIRDRSPEETSYYHNELQKIYNTRYFFWLSMPLFSSDMQTVIIDINFTNGGLYGERNTFILRKTEQQWKILHKLHSRWNR
jgi:hypothetical protein